MIADNGLFIRIIANMESSNHHRNHWLYAMLRNRKKSFVRRIASNDYEKIFHNHSICRWFSTESLVASVYFGKNLGNPDRESSEDADEVASKFGRVNTRVYTSAWERASFWLASKQTHRNGMSLYIMCELPAFNGKNLKFWQILKSSSWYNSSSKPWKNIYNAPCVFEIFQRIPSCFQLTCDLSLAGQNEAVAAHAHTPTKPEV